MSKVPATSSTAVPGPTVVQTRTQALGGKVPHSYTQALTGTGDITNTLDPDLVPKTDTRAVVPLNDFLIAPTSRD